MQSPAKQPTKRYGTSVAAVQHPHRFVTLDLLRGVAALVVVYFHTHALFGPILFPHGYLAVDFFFMLSGFVMMSAYGKKLDAGWPTFTFLKARFARLYPLYFLGLSLGFLFGTLFYLFNREHRFVSALIPLYLLGLGFIPLLRGPAGPGSYLYPLDTPTWSLFFELIANLLQALFLRRRSVRALLSVVLLSGLALALCALHRNTMNLGHTRDTFFYGFARVSFSYTGGMLLYRLWNRGAVRRRWSPITSALTLIILLGCPMPAAYAGAYDLAVTLIGFPVILILSASAVPPKPLAGTCLLLGNASYAIYVLHVPLTSWLGQLQRHVPLLRPLRAPWTGALNLIILLALSLMLDRIYDLPTRAYLRKTLRA